MTRPASVSAGPAAPAAGSTPSRFVPGLVATAYAALFLAGLYFVTGLYTRPGLPSAGLSSAAIVRYFLVNIEAVRISVYLSFLSELALGAFAAIVAGRLLGLGISAARAQVVLFAGFATAFVQTSSHLSEWVLTWPGLGRGTMLGLYYLLYAFGGPGFSILMGFFVGAIAVIAGTRRLLPGWVVWSGLVVALIGAISSINLLIPTTFPFTVMIPLTRFPALFWLIAAGVTLPLGPAEERRR
jgi:hypothetical protein